MKKATRNKIERVKTNISKFIAKQKRHPFGHGFLWAYVDGYKTYLAYIPGMENHSGIIAKANSYSGVTGAYINLD